MTITANKNITSRQEALKKLLTLHKDGKRTEEELIGAFSEEWFEYFRKLGFIRCGVAVVDNEAVRTYSPVMALIKKELEFGNYEPTKEDIELAKFFISYI
jgi:hypothetical protein